MEANLNQGTNGFFEFPKDSRTTTMTLEQLQRTLEVKDRFGNPPRNRPARADVFIESITDILRKNSVAYAIDDIFIQQEGFHPILAKGEEYPDNIYPVNKLLVERLITKIILPVDYQHDAAIAMSYTEKGVQLGFGLHVSICQNMCIFGAEDVLTTYKMGNYTADRMDVMLLKLTEWIRNFEQKFDITKEIVQNFIDYQITEIDTYECLGRLHGMTRRQLLGEINDSPFNATQFDKLMDGLVKDDGKAIESIDNVWQLYMAATNIIKPENYIATEIIPCNQKLAEFLVNSMG